MPPPQIAAIEQVIEAIRADASRGLSEQQIETVMLALHKMHDNLAAR